jgi:uncharacterized membrane protein YccC
MASPEVDAASVSTAIAKVRSMREAMSRTSFASGDVVDAVIMSAACLIAYWLMTTGLTGFVDTPTDFLGGMWAAIATAFVFRETSSASLLAGMERLIGTFVSFALCLPYLWIFPSTPVGMAVLLGMGTMVMVLLKRRNDIITTAITTIIVMVVAAISPRDAWQQPLLRLFDTVVGIAVGVSFRWIGSSISRSLNPTRAR